MDGDAHVHIWTESTVRAILKTCNDCPESRIVFNQYERPVGKNAPGAKSPDGWRVEDLKPEKPRTRGPRGPHKPYEPRKPDTEKLARWTEWQRLYLDEGFTTTAIAARVGVTGNQVAYGLKRLGTTMRKKGPQPGVHDASRDARIIELARAGKTYTEIGREFGITRERVRQLLKIAGLSGDEIHALVAARHVKPVVTHKHCALCGNDIPVEEWAAHRKEGVHRGTRFGLHHRERFEAVAADLRAGMKIKDICAKHGIFPSEVRRVRQTFGIPKINNGSWLPTRQAARERKDRIAAAIGRGLAAPTIAAVEGCSTGWVRTIAKQRGLALPR